MKGFKVIYQILKQLLKKYFFNFYSISRPINTFDVGSYKSLIKKENDNIITNFENLFSKLVLFSRLDPLLNFYRLFFLP